MLHGALHIRTDLICSLGANSAATVQLKSIFATARTSVTSMCISPHTETVCSADMGSGPVGECIGSLFEAQRPNVLLRLPAHGSAPALATA